MTMPITDPAKAEPAKAELPCCRNCGGTVVPCKCEPCGKPFRGIVHLDTNLHMCPLRNDPNLAVMLSDHWAPWVATR